MTVASATSPAVNDLANLLIQESKGGAVGARVSIGSRAQAFDYADTIPWAGSVFDSVMVDGLQYRKTLITPTGTPAAKTARGALKPVGVQLTTSSATLPKYSGTCTIDLEDLLDIQDLVPAIQNALFSQSLAALSADVALVLAGAALTATGADWTEAILNAIGVLPSASLLVVSPSDLAAIVSPAGGFIASQNEAQMVLFGLGVLPLPGLATGAAYVCTPSAVTVFDSAVNPAGLLDPYSLSTKNQTIVVTDLVAAGELTAPGNAVKVTVTGP